MVVIDLEMFGVYGVDGLYVVDVSVMFLVINGNIYVLVMMVVEKVFDLILGKILLLLEEVFWYCY